MRWVVITLVFFNVAYFGWQFLKPQHPSVSAEIASSHRLTLEPKSVVENESLALAIVDDIQTQGAELPVQSGEADSLVGINQGEHDLSLNTEPLTHNVSEALVPTDSASNAVEEKSEESVNPNKIMEAEPAPEPKASTLVLSCFWTEWSAKELKLASEFELIKTEQREKEISRSYLVWISPKATEEKTLERLRELKALAIESAYINRGAQKGGISLGLFSAEESVAIRLKEAAQLGINDASSVTRVRTQSESRALIKQISASTTEISEKWQKTDCLPIALTPVAQ